MTLPLHIGFTGTQAGMTDRQKERVWQLVGHRQFYAHHGDCIGADAEFDAIVRRAPNLYGVIMHPCDLAAKRAYCVPKYPHDVVRDVKSPLVRNEDIVAEGHCLIAASKTAGPVLRSGTWATIRLAVAAQKPVCVLFPDGGMMYPTPGVTWPGPEFDGSKQTSPCMPKREKDWCD